MDTWNKPTDLKRGVGWGWGLEEISLRTYKHLCIAHSHRQQCGEGRGGMGAEWKGAKLREIGDICNSVNNTKILLHMKHYCLIRILLINICVCAWAYMRHCILSFFL